MRLSTKVRKGQLVRVKRSGLMHSVVRVQSDLWPKGGWVVITPSHEGRCLWEKSDLHLVKR